MEKLRATLAQYKRWQPLDMYIERMEAHFETDFSIAVENAKALLESIGKEICKARSVDLAAASSVQGVLKKAFGALGFNGEQLVAQVSTSLATIGQNIGTLRNEISPTSHGKSLDELAERNNKVDLLTRDFLVDSTLVVAVFLIRAFEERQVDVTPLAAAAGDAETNYEDNEDFNSSWDETFGEFVMGGYSYAASEILFGLDVQAYQAECKAFADSGEEIPEGSA